MPMLTPLVLKAIALLMALFVLLPAPLQTPQRMWDQVDLEHIADIINDDISEHIDKQHSPFYDYDRGQWKQQELQELIESYTNKVLDEVEEQFSAFRPSIRDHALWEKARLQYKERLLPFLNDPEGAVEQIDPHREDGYVWRGFHETGTVYIWPTDKGWVIQDPNNGDLKEIFGTNILPLPFGNSSTPYTVRRHVEVIFPGYQVEIKNPTRGN